VTGWTTLPGTLLTDADWLADRVDRMARSWGCPDRRTNATLWWYSASAVLLGPAVRSLVLTGELVDLSPAAVRFTTRANGYLERVIPGDGVVPDDLTASMIALGRHLDDVLGLIIKPLAATGGAGQRSLWAIATDSLASAVLAATTVTPAGSANADHVATSIAAASQRLRPLPPIHRDQPHPQYGAGGGLDGPSCGPICTAGFVLLAVPGAGRQVHQLPEPDPRRASRPADPTRRVPALSERLPTGA